MPWWPIMMPSEAVGAPKICATPPAASNARHRGVGELCRWALHGVMSSARGHADHRLLEVVVLEAEGVASNGSGRGPCLR